MRVKAFNALLFAGLAVWMLFTHPWVAPGLALIALGQLFLPLLVWRNVPAYGWLVSFLAFQFVGPIYILSLFGGTPNTGAFWIVFASASVIVVPAVWLFARIKPRTQKAVG
jgi:hypothetical protein